MSNRLRGVLAEFGVIVAPGDGALGGVLAGLGELAAVPASTNAVLDELQQHWQQVRERMAGCDARIAANAKPDTRCARLQRSIGVGPLTGDALVASIGNGTDFKNGRQLAAWLGLTPAQQSSGGKTRLGAITCRGDHYLRTLRIQGARSSLRAKAVAPPKATPDQVWIRDLAGRLPFGKVLAAIANKPARQAWAMLARDEDYDDPDSSGSLLAD